MVVTHLASSELYALPEHSRAKVTLTIDNFLTEKVTSQYIKITECLFGIYANVTSVPRLIFFYQLDKQIILLGIIMKKNIVFTDAEQSVIVERSEQLSDETKLYDWQEIRKNLLSDCRTSKKYENEALKEKMQRLLQEWRSISGLSKAQIAEKLGVSYKHICNMETNPSKLSIITYYNYARVCGISKPAIYL